LVNKGTYIGGYKHKSPGYPFINNLMGVVDAPGTTPYIPDMPEIAMQDKNGCIKFAFTGYCMKCKDKTHAKHCENTILRNGRPAMKGWCTECGTRMYKIGRN